jgi:hypothetical protein
MDLGAASCMERRFQSMPRFSRAKEVSSQPRLNGLHALICYVVALPLEKVMTKERTRGDELSVIRRANRSAGVLGDGLLFRSSEKDRRVGTNGRNRIRRESKSLRGAEHFRHPRIRARPELGQGYPRYVTNSDGIHALSIGSVWQAGQRPKQGLYRGGVRSNEEAVAVKVMHDSLLSTRS